ncbi:putative lipoprotein [Hyphomonas neptunium ATCC 15444]|uniref:Putative lipoprotein n=2 Tax=Hyphomonas TaxID=85 RepID=Q0C656_HYPNA|nr:MULTISPECIES: hypothetical protein [Hyphomonas]ABI76349.1 putative lipoprotein [Hyphomonas neptunium ATCC 15444]KCZ94867.1 putative lipoprotein [Hyphomonas hirschiana VP5]
MAFTVKSCIVSLVAAATLGGCAANTSGMTALASADTITAGMEGETAPDGTVIKCRSIQVTGSRFPVKECKSEAAWENFDQQMASNAKNETDKFQRLNTGCSTTGSC